MNAWTFNKRINDPISNVCNQVNHNRHFSSFSKRFVATPLDFCCIQEITYILNNNPSILFHINCLEMRRNPERLEVRFLVSEVSRKRQHCL